MSILTSDKAVRKNLPIVRGVLDYFPNAIAEVAYVSVIGNQQHNSGEPLHWAREKSDDHADSAVRHILERGTFDVDGVRHTAKAAWRILALLQLEIEASNDPTNGPTVDETGFPVSVKIEDAASDSIVNGVTDDKDRTPVFVNPTSRFYYFVADNGAINFADSYRPHAPPFPSGSYQDLEALYDAVETGMLIEVNNDNDGNQVDLDECGTIDGTEPLPGFDPDESIEEQLANARYNNQTDLSEGGGA